MKHTSSLIALMVLGYALAFAQETSTFLNLGFSGDSYTFAFASYGVRADEYPYAELFVVDVAKNEFVNKGKSNKIGSKTVNLGQDGINTFYKLLTENTSILSKYKIDSENSGRPVYILLNGEAPRADLEFTDFETQNEYKVALIQKNQDKGASFYLLLSISLKDGSKIIREVGLANLVRPNVLSYRIRQIILGPNSKSLIFVIEKRFINPVDGLSTGFMVETVAIRS